MEDLTHLDGDAKALVEGKRAALASHLGQAVDEAGELPVLAGSDISCKPCPGKVQWVHDQQGTSASQTTCSPCQPQPLSVLA